MIQSLTRRVRNALRRTIDVEADEYSRTRGPRAQNEHANEHLYTESVTQQRAVSARQSNLLSRVARYRWRELDRLSARHGELVSELNMVNLQLQQVRANLYDPTHQNKHHLDVLCDESDASDDEVDDYIARQNERRERGR